MGDLKTRPTGNSVTHFLNAIQDEKRKQDSYAVLDLMKEITGEPPVLWGSSIIGFGTYHYQYASGREGDWMLTGFSPRKQNLTIYIMSGFEKYDSLLQDLGQFKTGVSCLYIKRLDDIDRDVFKKLIQESVQYMKSRHL